MYFFLPQRHVPTLEDPVLKSLNFAHTKCKNNEQYQRYFSTSFSELAKPKDGMEISQFNSKYLSMSHSKTFLTRSIRPVYLQWEKEVSEMIVHRLLGLTLIIKMIDFLIPRIIICYVSCSRRIMLEYTRNQMLFEVKLTKRENRKKLNLHYEILITNMLSIENGQQSKAVIVNLALSTIKNAYWIQMGH